MINKKLKKYFLVFSLLALVFFVLPVNNVYGDDWEGINNEISTESDPVDTGGGDRVAGFLAWVTLLIATLFGKLLTLTTGFVNELFQINDFEVEGVKTGWIIVRDVCNMSFILALLLIAFATILRLENYSMKKYLPKLLIMAVMINFSKSICLFLIDISQIVMLTFGNAFTGSTSNFVTMLHIEKLMAISSAAKFSEMPWDMFWAAGLALIFILIAFFVMLMMMGLLIMRMVYFWVLIVLSPIAFLSTAVPGMSKYWGQWWGEFTKYLMVGPVLAFFTWLALTVANNITIFDKLNFDANGNPTGYTAFITDIEKKGAIMPFVLGIGLLLGAIKISKDIGEAGMGFGMNMMNKAKSGTMGFTKKHTVDRGVSAVKWGRDKAVAGGAFVAGAGARIGLAGLGTADRLAGRGADKMFGTKLGEKGVVTSAGAGVVNSISNLRGSIAARRGEKESLAQAKKDYYSAKLSDPNAIMKHDGKKYKADNNGEFKELDANDKMTAQSLIANGKIQKEMGVFGAALYDSWKKSQSDAWGALNIAQSEAIDKATKVITNANSSASELHNIMQDRTASSEMKMAAALKLAKDGDFNDEKAIERARQVLQANQIKLKELNSDIDKNQAHIAYDFKSQEGRDKFKKRVDVGKIDTTKMDSDAYKNQDIIKALEEYHGKDTTRVLETAFKRGKKYETSVASGLIGARDLTKLNDDKFAKLHAKLTGDIAESFKNATNNVDFSSLENYLKNAKANDINKISKANLYKMISNNTSQSGQAYQTTANSVTYAKLKSMHRQGDSPELVRELRSIILQHSTSAQDKDSINGDAELMSV